MATYYVPVVLSSSEDAHVRIEVGAYVTPEVLPISATTGNLLVNMTDGLLVSANELISSSTGNILTRGLDGKLYCPAPEVAIDLMKIVSNAPENLLRVQDGKLYVYMDSHTAEHVSTQVPNYVYIAGDGGLVVDGNSVLSNEAGNAIGISPIDGKLYYRGLRVSDILSEDSRQLIGYDSEGKILLTEDMLASVKGIEDAPSDGYKYARVNGTWTRIDGYLLIDAADKVLTQSDFGLLANIALVTDNATGDLLLVGRSGTIISRIPAPDGSMITDAGTVTDPSGQPAGEYLYITFNTSAGSNTVYINVTHLVDEYTSGDNSILVDNYKISVVVDPNSGLTTGALGVTFATGYGAMTSAEKSKLNGIEAGAQKNVPYTSGNGAIVVSGQTISGKVDAAAGLSISASTGITTASGYQLMTDAQSVKLAGIEAGAQANKAGTGVTLGTGGVINVTYGTTAGTATQGNDSRLNRAAAATATADGATAGITLLAADSDISSRNKAATPAGVASQIAAADLDNVPTSRFINTTAPLTGGGSLNADRTLAISAAGAADLNTYGTSGSVIYAAHTDYTSKDKAATPYNVKYQINNDPALVRSTLTLTAVNPLYGGGTLEQSRSIGIKAATAATSTNAGSGGAAYYASFNEILSDTGAVTPRGLTVRLSPYLLLKPATYPYIVINVSTEGDDSTADGSAEKPFATVNRALLYTKATYCTFFHPSLIAGEINILINIAAGTYETNNSIPLVDYVRLGGRISIQGDPAGGTILSTTHNNGPVFDVYSPVEYMFNYLTFQNSSGGSQSCLAVHKNASVTCNNVTFRTVRSSISKTNLFTAYGNSHTQFSGCSFLAPYACGSMIIAQQCANVVGNSFTMDGIADVTVLAYANSYFAVEGSPVINGNVTGGIRYYINGPSCINVSGGGENVIPGTSAGIVVNGGIYM